MTLRNFNAIQRSIDAERTEYDGWAPNGRAVRQARAHLASLPPEYQAKLRAEWPRDEEYV